MATTVKPPPLEVFENMFEEQYHIIYNYIYFHIRNVEDAEDLTADVFVRAYQYWGSYSETKGTLGEWLGGIARNTLKTYLKKKANLPQFVDLPDFVRDESNIESEYLMEEDIRQIILLINELPKRQRELLIMKYLLGLNNREIAGITNMSESNVGITLHRSIKIIRNKIK